MMEARDNSGNGGSLGQREIGGGEGKGELKGVEEGGKYNRG